MKSKAIVPLVLIAAVASFAISVTAISGASAQEPDDAPTKPVRAVKRSVQPISLTLGKGGLYETSSPYAKVSVADDRILEVTPQSDRTFIFNPKQVGSTNVLIFDTKNMLIATLDVDVSSGAVQARKLGGEVTIYGRLYDKEGAVVKPTLYLCGATSCEIAREGIREAPPAAATPTPVATPPTSSQEDERNSRP